MQFANSGDGQIHATVTDTSGPRLSADKFYYVHIINNSLSSPEERSQLPAPCQYWEVIVYINIVSTLLNWIQHDKDYFQRW